MRSVLVVFPEPSSRWGGERLRKLCVPLPELGWCPVFLATDERVSRRMHGESSQRRWWGAFEAYRAWDANPFVAGSVVRRAVARRTGRGPAPGVTAAAGARPDGARDSVAVHVLKRVWLPDAYAGWIPFALTAGLAAIARTRPAALFSSYPPASSHTVALLLHRATGLPWVADFRDPWADAGEHTYPGHTAPWLARRLERATLANAAAVTAVGPTLAETFRVATACPVEVLSQGFEPQRSEPRVPGGVLRLVHMGTFAAWPSDPGPLLRAATRLAARGAPLRIEQVGQTFDCDAAVEEGVRSGVLTIHEPVAREEALRRISTADAAVVVRTEPGRLWVTTKLWDYLACRTPILVVADPECDAARIVSSTGTGFVAPYWDEPEIERTLELMVAAWKAGTLCWSPDAAALAAYESRTVARTFTELLERVAR